MTIVQGRGGHRDRFQPKSAKVPRPDLASGGGGLAPLRGIGQHWSSCRSRICKTYYFAHPKDSDWGAGRAENLVRFYVLKTSHSPQSKQHARCLPMVFSHERVSRTPSLFRKVTSERRPWPAHLTLRHQPRPLTVETDSPEQTPRGTGPCR